MFAPTTLWAARFAIRTVGLSIALASAAVALGALGPAWAEEAELRAPPPVSGRSLAQPETLQPSDMLARVLLIRGHLEQIRVYMGRPAPRLPLVRVEGAQMREVYVQTVNMYRRVMQLTFEQLRMPYDFEGPPEHPPGPGDIFEMLDRSLVRVLQLERSLGIARAVPEPAQPPTTTPSEVINAVVEVGALLNGLLDQETTSSVVYSVTTMALSVARSIHVAKAGRFLPKTPPFVPAKTPADVYRVLLKCLASTRTLAESVGARTLRLVPTEVDREVEIDDASELSSLLVSELVFLHKRMLGRPARSRFVQMGRKFPSHLNQRALELAGVLDSLVESSR